jgi:hypothetical protein
VAPRYWCGNGPHKPKGNNMKLSMGTKVGVTLALGLSGVIGAGFVSSGNASAWGNGHICFEGQTHTFEDEASYYAFLAAHPGAVEGDCVAVTTTVGTPVVVPTSTAAPTTTVPEDNGPTTTGVCSPPNVTFEDGSCGTPYSDAPDASTTTVPAVAVAEPPVPCGTVVIVHLPVTGDVNVPNCPLPGTPDGNVVIPVLTCADFADRCDLPPLCIDIPVGSCPVAAAPVEEPVAEPQTPSAPAGGFVAPAVTPAAPVGSQLPSTGFPVGMVALVSAGVLGLGLMLLRWSLKRPVRS